MFGIIYFFMYTFLFMVGDGLVDQIWGQKGKLWVIRTIWVVIGYLKIFVVHKPSMMFINLILIDYLL